MKKSSIIGGIFAVGIIGAFIANKIFNTEKNNFVKEKNVNEETPKEKKKAEEPHKEKPEKKKESAFSNIDADNKIVLNDNATISSYYSADEIRNILTNMKY